MADFIGTVIRERPNCLLCLPAGETPTLTFDLLATDGASGALDFGKVRFIGLDDWLGVPFDSAGSCRGFMYRRLFNPLNIQESRIIYFNAMSLDPASECVRIDRHLAQYGPIDLTVLGIGMNGHLGLNEPGVDPALSSHVVTLDETTKSVATKYFSSNFPLSRGITLGMKQLMESRIVALMASGDKKAAMLKMALEGPISNRVPASLLRSHPDFHIHADAQAVSLLRDRE
jgi:glucosamine-6-phosphate isomerase